MTDRELLQEALDALTYVGDKDIYSGTIDALRARLSQPEQKPVAWISHNAGLYHGKPDESLNPLPLYTTPPQREWQTLTENEIKHLWYEACQTNLELTSQLIVHLARNIEAKLKEKNT